MLREIKFWQLTFDFRFLTETKCVVTKYQRRTSDYTTINERENQIKKFEVESTTLFDPLQLSNMQHANTPVGFNLAANQIQMSKYKDFWIPFRVLSIRIYTQIHFRSFGQVQKAKVHSLSDLLISRLDKVKFQKNKHCWTPLRI